MKRRGRDGSDSEPVGVDVPGVCDSHFTLENFGVMLDSILAITPERIAIPIVPHPKMQSVYPPGPADESVEYIDSEFRVYQNFPSSCFLSAGSEMKYYSCGWSDYFWGTGSYK
jgi:hypothetical protein